jgi:hypothetical protein
MAEPAPSDPARTSRLRRAARVVTTVLVALAVALAIAEAVVRVAKPRPPVQIVRGPRLRLLDGVPVWGHVTDRENRECVEQHPERIRVLFFGTSITFGSGLTAAEAFTAQLQERLNRARPVPGFCVLSFAQPGFAFQQTLAVARVEVARYQPALIMWENWVEWRDFALIGDTAYCIKGLRVRPDGAIGVKGVPDTLNRVLLRRSRLYEYVTLVAGERAPLLSEDEYARRFLADRLAQVPELAQSVGARLAFYLAPPLDRPFPELVASPPGWHTELLAFAQARGVPAYLLQQELVDLDYRAVRADICCHYNAAGHRALVPVMERIVLRQLDGPR